MILEWNKSCIELTALYVHPKNSLRSHLRATKALGHSRLSVENKFLENKSGRIFLRSTSLLYCQQIWVRANQPFILFIHHIWGERVLWGSVLSCRPRTKCSSSQFFKTNCIHSIFRTIKARVGFSRNRSKNFQNHLYGQSVLTFDKLQICKEILKELLFNMIKGLFFVNGFVTMCNLKRRLIRAVFWILLQAMFMNDWKQTAKRWKLHFWDY